MVYKPLFRNSKKKINALEETKNKLAQQIASIEGRGQERFLKEADLQAGHERGIRMR